MKIETGAEIEHKDLGLGVVMGKLVNPYDNTTTVSIKFCTGNFEVFDIPNKNIKVLGA